jgi:hypothetical protein
MGGVWKGSGIPVTLRLCSGQALTDQEWQMLEPLLPLPKPGRPSPYRRHSGDGERHLLRSLGRDSLALLAQGVPAVEDGLDSLIATDKKAGATGLEM